MAKHSQKLYSMKHPINRVCFYYARSNIGDLFYNLPFLALLRQRLPHAHITWGVEKDNARHKKMNEVFAPFIDEVIALPYIGAARGEPFTKKLKHFLTSPKPKLDFDIVLLRRLPPQSKLFARRLFNTKAIFFADDFPPFTGHSRAEQKELFKYGKAVSHEIMALRHVIDEITPATQDAPQYPPIPLALSAYRARAAQLLPDGTSYIGFAAGVGDASRKWPLDNYIALAKQVQTWGHEPIFFIGPQDQDLIAPLSAALPGIRFPEMEAPESERDFALMMALGERVKYAVVNDSGNAHILAAVSTPMIILHSVFPARLLAPLRPNIISIDVRDYVANSIYPSDIPLSGVRDILAAQLQQI